MLQKPHGGKLSAIPDLREDVFSEGDLLNAIDVSYETAVTVMGIKNGILSPLKGFHGSSDTESILMSQRLANGLPWSIPTLLTVDMEASRSIREGDAIILMHNGKPLAELKISEKYAINKEHISRLVFGTTSLDHPGVQKVNLFGDIALAGDLKSANNVNHQFSDITMFPADTRKYFMEKGWKTVSAFQTRNVPHRGHEEIQRLALRSTDGLFINPVIGRKKKGDYTDEAILKSYGALIKTYYPEERVLMTPLHYEMMYAGPREAVMHAIMRKNYGCTHFIVGRDHAGVGNFYGPYDAQENLRSFEDLGIEVIPFQETFYCRICEQLVTERECSHPYTQQEHFSGTKIRELIVSKGSPPRQLMREEVFSAISSIPDPFVH